MENFLNPIQTLKQLKINKNMVAADFGSGSGGWVLPLAKILENGKIFAVDILAEPLSALESKAKLNNLSNIETIRADVEKGVNILSGSCDLVLLTNLLFQLENKKAVFEEAKRVLRSGGKILVVDWKKTAKMGPEQNRVSPVEVKKIAKEVGLELEKEFEAGKCHFSLV